MVLDISSRLSHDGTHCSDDSHIQYIFDSQFTHVYSQNYRVTSKYLLYVFLSQYHVLCIPLSDENKKLQKKNKRGPKIEPCGAPALMYAQSDEAPGKTTH